jgi:hypothetical protein
MQRLCEELQQPSSPVVTQVLVLRSGSSPASLGLLQAAIASPNSTIRELEFVGLSSLAELTGALVCCCHGGKIRRLRLENYRLPTRPSSRQQEAVARSICDHVLGEAHISDSTKANRETPVALKTLERLWACLWAR